MIGIYKITNKVNNKIYIGQSINIAERWREHRYRYNRVEETSYNYPLYRAFRKYTLDNFSFEIIEECTFEELDKRETYWIQYYNSILPNGYNQNYGGGGRIVYLKPVYQYDLFGRFIQEYPNASIAASKTGNTLDNIRDCLNKRNNMVQTQGYQWSYVKTDNIGHHPKYTPVICFSLQGEKIAEYHNFEAAIKATSIDPRVLKTACDNHTPTYSHQWRYWDENPDLTKLPPVEPYQNGKRAVNQYDLNGNLLHTFSSITEASNQTSIGTAHIITVCKKIEKSAGNYVWRYADEDTGDNKYQANYNTKNIGQKHAVKQYDLNDNYLNTYESIKTAGLAIGRTKNLAGISLCCSGKRKTAFGYKWRYVDEEEQ